MWGPLIEHMYILLCQNWWSYLSILQETCMNILFVSLEKNGYFDLIAWWMQQYYHTRDSWWEFTIFICSLSSPLNM